MFPCVWVQKVLQRRILGASTWEVLQKRRRELRLVGMNATFLTFTDIITASQVHVHHKRYRQQQQSGELCAKLSSVWPRVRRDAGHAKEPEEHEPLPHLVKVSTNAESRVSTPRKILPSMYVQTAVLSYNRWLLGEIDRLTRLGFSNPRAAVADTQPISPVRSLEMCLTCKS